MSTTLGPGEMRELADKHGACEMAHDWEGALATMSDAPFYEFFPYRLRIKGPEAITMLWTRVFQPGGNTDGRIRCFDERFMVPDTHELSEYANDDSLVEIRSWAFIGEDGTPRSSKSVVFFTFDGDRIRSESMYVDTSTMPYMDQVFDAEFRSHPDVEEI